MNYVISAEDELECKIKALEFKIAQIHAKSSEIVIANTQNGRIRGAQRRSIYDDIYYSFEHIPYAQPPLGELRFRAPQPMGTWKELRDCSEYGAKSMQRALLARGAIEGSEDCLYLNVYTNSVKPKKPRPVMVWIHGGSFVSGEATREWYGPDYFMKKDIVLVTVQYRLGALGFLSLNNPKLQIPGNAGLKDQIMALKWIKRNCTSFGGNPDCITVFGESAGSVCIMLLTMSEQAKGLFHRVIAQSGVASPQFFDAGTQHAYPLAKAAGYDGPNNERDILNYLLGCTAERILKAEEALGGLTFMPFQEPYFTKHTVVCRPLEKLQPQAWGNAIPLMLGGTSNEGLFFRPTAIQHPQRFQKLMTNCLAFVPKDAAPKDTNSPEYLEKALKLRQIHVKGEKPTAEDFYEIMSYQWFWHPIQQTINARLQYAKKSATFLYRFDFDSEQLQHPFRIVRWGRGVRGVAHTDELAYLFSSALARRMEQQSREYLTIERMIALWTTFAETGNPSPKPQGGKYNSMKNIKWRPLRRQDDTWWCLNISDDLKFMELPEMPKLRIWQQLYTMHHELPSKQEVKKDLVDLSVYAKAAL